MSRAVFIDRDGTLNVERHYLHDPEALEIFPGTGLALRRLMDAGYVLFIVTNQSGIGRGYYTEADMHAVNARLAQILAEDGVWFEKIYFAPEAPEEKSPGRKPSPKFLREAESEFCVDLAQSYMVGDKLLDLQCGWKAGVKKSILVRTGYGSDLECDEPDTVAKAAIVDDITAAVDWILENA
jgi:D-glycero-D-manno-heptose 1,7-bisphosphate phosphatase|tara:strand:- start:1111 stop:1656 length:546 start_codon:yes stop_codon:yes gene_type:complete